MKKKINIYVAAHKEAQFPDNSIYVSIEVGAYNKEKFLKVTDNTGDNISDKNSSFCELTAAYWILYNDNSDIVGLTHYRRYFFKKDTNKLEFVLDESDIKDILKQYDMIVPNKNYLLKYKTVKDAYVSIHKEEDWDLCKEIIIEKYPDYEEAFEQLSNSRSFYTCNMFISSKKIFDDYYKWLFDILFELEKRVDISNYDDYNKRIFGFMSERLFNVWIIKNNINIKEVPVYNTDKKMLPQQIENKLKKVVLRLTR